MTTKTINKIKIFVGISALCLLFSFNLMHALNDYGVSNPNNTLHPEVLAQTNTAGDGGATTNPGGGTSNPGGGTSNPGGDTGCNWQSQTCPRVNAWTSPQRREVCLMEGDGNSCTCGEVTRPCP